MSHQPEILYAAEVAVSGGRAGHALSSDGRLDLNLDVPTEMGGTGGSGTNPEQLFAAAHAACFQSALLRIASGRKLDTRGWRIVARVAIGPIKSGGFGLSAGLQLDAPGIGHDEAHDLMTRAHESCPYSRALRGNVDVRLTVGATDVEHQTA